MASLIERYRDRLPVGESTPVVTLGEGSTPLLPAPRVSQRLGVDVWLKWEGANPTGSFKDRGMTVAISKALEQGAEAVVCASTGNTAASAAAYAARAGLPALILQPRGAVATAKVAQTRCLGAHVLEVRGSFDEALGAARELAARGTHVLVNSLNPHRLEGQKTAAFEVCDDLGRAPDILAIPVGNAGNISAYWQGFGEYEAAGLTRSKPALWGFQAAGAAPLVHGRRVDRPETVATAIRIGNPASWDKAIAARDESHGRIEAVTDDEILSAYRDLARLEGVFCEPASAASVAGVTKMAAAGVLDPDATVVAVLTGHGLKDPHTAERQVPGVIEAAPTLAAVAVALGWS
jgi:threonine synthase